MSIRSLGDVVARTSSRVSVAEDATIVALSQALAHARVDAVAVLSTDTDALAGIATSRDVAKCIARGEDLQSIKVAQIMTAHPITLPPAETPANALALMREGGFRHIPVVSEEDGSVLGIVDVLNLAYDAITRLQVTYSMIPSRRSFEFMRAARETIEKPTLRPIVERAHMATLTRDSSVTEACETLVQEHLAAVVIVDKNGVLDGIFTCRDVVNRIVVKHRNPITTTLDQVMTPNPDCAGPDFTILESLQRMQACGFRHLPVVEDHTRIVIGLVDVLQLASDAISGLQSVADQSSRNESSAFSSGPRGTSSRGLPSIFSSLFSRSYGGSGTIDNEQQPLQQLPPLAPVSNVSQSLPPRPRAGVGVSRRHYSHLSSEGSRTSRVRALPPDVPLASFKFKDLNNEFRRIKVPMTLEQGSFDQFVVDVRRRFAGSSSVGSLKIKYVDEDGDEVLISNDEDLASCFEDFADNRSKTIQLRVYEVDKPSSSQVPSPISSNGSPLIQSSRSIQGRENAAAETVPSLKLPRDTQPATDGVGSLGMPRTTSRPVLHTPTMIKVAEAHQGMLDGKNDEAIALYDEALRLDPENVRAYGGRGAVRLFNGDSTHAEEDYRAAIRLLEAGKGGSIGDLTFEMCIVGLVEALIDQRRYEEAMTVANRIDPASGNTGCTDAFRDELDSASNAAREALEAAEFGDAMSCYSNALRVETAYLQLVPNETARASLRLGRAKCYKALQDFDMALEDYEAAVKLEPESVAAHKGCGKCLAELEQIDRAYEAYETAHKLDFADDEVSREMETLRKLLPDPLQGRKDEIAKLGSLLGGMKLPGHS